MKRLGLAIALVVAVAAVAPPALAQTETDARELFAEGNVHLQRAMRSRGAVRARELRAALNFYHRSLRITRARSVLFNTAFCYENLRRWQDAYTYYSEYLAIEDLTEADRTTAEERLAAVRPHVALVEVQSTPPGATVYVDRRDLSPHGVTPITVATTPGSHRLILVLEGHEEAERAVEVALGETEHVAVELEAHPALVHIETDPAGAVIRVDDEEGPVYGVTPLTTRIPAGPHRIYATLEDRAGRATIDAPPGGELTVTVELAAPTTPGTVAITVDVEDAEILVDGEPVGRAPLSRLSLAPGIHRISVRAGDDWEPWSDVVEIGPGHDVNLEVHLAPTVPRRRFGPWPNVGVVLATTLGVAAAATGGWALALHADFAAIEETCRAVSQACAEGTVLREEALELATRLRDYALATDILIGVAAAVAVTSFALMILNREVSDSSRVTIALSPVRGGAVASLAIGGMLRMSP